MKPVDATEVCRNLAALAAALPAFAEQLTAQVAAQLAAEAQRLAPPTALLVLHKAGPGAWSIAATLPDSGGDVVALHENLATPHATGGAKFLERPLLTIGLHTLPRTLAAQLLAELRRNIHVHR